MDKNEITQAVHSLKAGERADLVVSGKESLSQMKAPILITDVTSVVTFNRSPGLDDKRPYLVVEKSGFRRFATPEEVVDYLTK